MPDAYKYFLVALHNVLNNTPITQRKVAERSGTAYQTINAIVWDKHRAGPGKQEAIALACGFSLVDFLSKGREIVKHGGDKNPDAGQPQPRYFVASESTVEINPTNALAAVTAFVNQTLSTTQNLCTWQHVFENLSSAICIVKNGTVILRNQANRWICTGTTVKATRCELCRGGKGFNLECATDKKTHMINGPSTSYAQMGRGYYIIGASMSKNNQNEYQIVIARRLEAGGE